jgi:hypothetical protein
MADRIKSPIQALPAAGVLKDAYTVPVAAYAVISTGFVCNQSSQQTTFRISIAVQGMADAAFQYLYYDVVIDGNDTFAFTCGVTLIAGDVVRVQSANGQCSFQFSRMEGDL